MGELRKYQASHLFLRISLLWFSAVIPKSFRMSAIFKILDSTKKEDMAKQFGGTIPELRQRYPFTTTHSPSDAVDAENRKRFLTSLLFLLIHDDSVFDPQKQLTLEEEFKNRPDNRTLPKLVGGPIAPKWGPHANEDWGEPYNRAWMCIAQFNTSWSRWHERHGKEGGLAKTIIPDTHLPTFMAASNAAQSTPRSTPTVKVKQAIPMLEPKTFSLYWADDIARKEELEAMHHVIPVSSLRGPDPRAVPAAEWRDKVRVLYDFEKLKLNFSSLKLHYTEDEQDEALDLLNEDWSVVQAVCTRVDQANLQKIRFRTRPQEIGEILREGSGVPSVLKNYVMCEDNGRLQKTDAALGQEEDNHLLAAPLDESKGDPNPEGDPPLGKPHQKAAKKRAEKEAVEAKEDVFVEKTLEQLTDRVGRKRDPTSGPGMPDPVKAYAHADTDDVLREHGGVDIRLPELRREWTMKMLVKHGAGVSIKTAQPVDPVVMELSGATSVSRRTSPKTPLTQTPMVANLPPSRP